MNHEPPDWLFQNIAEASKHSSRIHALFIVFVFFCVLALLGTSDRQIILDAQTQLPLVGNNVSFSGFCYAIVVIGMSIFMYLQVYIQKLRRLTRMLKSDYPLSKPEQVYPWIVTIAEESNLGIVGFFQRAIVEISLWYFLPILLSIIPYWLVRAHSPIPSYLFALVPVLSLSMVIVYRAHYEDIGFWRLFKTKKVFLGFSVLIIAWSIFLTAFCIPWTMKGASLYWKRGMMDFAYHKPPYSDLLSTFGSWWCVDLSRQNLVKKPDIDFPSNYWVILSGVHLEGANLNGSILTRARLDDAHLQNAWMLNASFEKASFERANLNSVKARSSNFENASFLATDLEWALLDYANFRNAKFGQSNLSSADLMKSNLEGSNLYNCNLTEATLVYTNLQKSDLRSAKLHRACLTRANLQNADMGSAELDSAYPM